MADKDMEKKLIIIGGGPAGLAAALEASRHGIEPGEILILERDRELGGILNQCIHAGFGLHFLGLELTGPEYSGRFIEQIKAAGIGYITGAMVLGVTDNRIVTFVSPEHGFVSVKAGAVVLAMGCRERTRGALNIPGTRPQGIFTAGTAQRYVNIEGIMPGSRVVILGSGDIGLIMARRLTLEGAKVLRVCELMPYSGGLARNIAQCLDDFAIPLYLSHTVTEIRGRERVEGVVISRVDENRRPIPGSEEYVECDTLLLSVGLIPENELSRSAGVELDPVTGGAVVDQNLQTSVPGVFACGNVLQVHDLVDYVTREAFAAGSAAADFALGKLSAGSAGIVRTEPGFGVRYIVPQKITIAEGVPVGELRLFYRSTATFRDVKVRITADGVKLRELSRKIVTPGEMENAIISPELTERLRDGVKTLRVELILKFD
jgi:Thioredoxin reductase